jgi:hypothetical protein
MPPSAGDARVEARPRAEDLPRFERRLGSAGRSLAALGTGHIGGKAQGLVAAQRVLEERWDETHWPGIRVAVPSLVVIGTDLFDAFVAANRLDRPPADGASDRAIAAAVQRADLPAALVGDLYALARQFQAPLAVRSSSLLEDALRHPFAGVYGTKMIPGSPFDPETRFRQLVDAVKFVYASTFLAEARAYVLAAGRRPDEEKMAVVIQEVVGRRHASRFYPDFSGVARSFNFYPTGHATPEQGVASLALGLGKTIVDGGRSWTYSPAWPRASPPYASPGDLLDQTQRDFWAVHMGRPPAYDPVSETEYLVKGELADAEADGTLRLAASTYDPGSDRLAIGTGARGVRLLNFAPLLVHDELPFNAALRELLALFAEASAAPVEIEFALAAHASGPAFLGFLQVRPMRVGAQLVELAPQRLADPLAVVASERTVGNGVIEGLRDVVFVRRDAFDAARTRAIAEQVRALNARLTAEGRPYVLVGFGRWGSSDPWLGVPVAWADVAGARVLVEAALPQLRAEPSQGAHFFHNLIGFQVPYFCIPLEGPGRVDWEWLERLPAEEDTGLVRRVRSPVPLRCVADGRHGRGVVVREP